MTVKQVPLKKISAELDRIAKQNHEAAIRGLRAAAVRIQGLIITETIPRTKPTPVDRGIYRAGWTVDILPNGARLRNWVPWAYFIEEGVLPKRVKISRKMIDALTEWVRRKGIGGTTKHTNGGPVLVEKPTPLIARSIAWAMATVMKKRTGIHGGKGGRGILKRTLFYAPKFIEAEIIREIEKLP